MIKNSKPKKIITEHVEFISPNSTKTNGSINIIDSGIRSYDFIPSQYIDFSFMVNPLYMVNDNIDIRMVLETKIADNSDMVKFKMELKEITKDVKLTEKELHIGSEGEITEWSIAKFKIKRLSKNPIYLGRITRVPCSNGHSNPIWVHGIKITYNVSNR